MYIWVILATFLAMLASYTLSVRPDMRAITVEPLAGATLGKMVAQHKAAANYVKFNKYPYAPDRQHVDYVPGIIGENDLLAEMPYGYVLTGNYTSQIFCMNNSMTTAYDYAGGENPCDVRENRRMVVTYGPVPARWLSLNSAMERPNADFMNAMWSMVNAGEELGYMAPADASEVHVSQENPSGSDIRLFSRGGTDDLFVPRAVVDDAQFKSVCDLSKNWVCLVYMSSI